MNNEFLEKMRDIQENLLDFLDNNDDENEGNYRNLNQFFDNLKNHNEQHELKLFLRLLSTVSSHHHRVSNFFRKIEKILKNLKSQIQIYYSNDEIFNIFKDNKRILLFLIQEGILIFDSYIIKSIINNTEYIKDKYLIYFAPEIKKFVNENSHFKIEQNGYDLSEIIYMKLPENFEEDREIGENENYISRLIRNDLINEFIIYVNKTNYSLQSTIISSIYETNSFLATKQKSIYKTTLIEYAAFFGSIQIVRYLLYNEIELESSLWIYAIHSNNPELIHFLEENEVYFDDKIIMNCFIESIICHHNAIANYIVDNYMQVEIENLIDIKFLKYYNFAFVYKKFINQQYLYNLCKYDYYAFVEFLLKGKKIDINKIIIYYSFSYKKIDINKIIIYYSFSFM